MGSSKTFTAQASDGESIEVMEERFAQGMMKDAHWTADRKRVALWYRHRPDAQAIERLSMITGVYRERIFNQVGGDYWSSLFCWPTAMLRHQDRVGILVPAYSSNFFFEFGSSSNDASGIRGKDKSGKWFTTPKHRARTLDQRELGDWLGYLKICLKIARATRRLHSAGLAHSDLSYQNVLIDPRTAAACVIDVDGLVVPGKYPPDVVGTPDFIAPEVVRTSHLQRDDPARQLPQRATDLHALSVLVYMYLLYRHPLRGGKVHDADDDARDELLTMGERALFVEHPGDTSNRIRIGRVMGFELPWADCIRLPFRVTGPYLSKLFEAAFITGLHNPSQRPSALDWENALVKTIDLVQPCRNTACQQKWFVFDNSTKPRCPFCGTSFSGVLPMLNFYSSRKEGAFRPDDHRLMVWNGQSLYRWHTNSFVSPNERVSERDRKRVGYFVLHEDRWWLVNETLSDLAVVGNKARSIPIGSKVELSNGLQLLLERGDGGRLTVVQEVTA